MMNFEDPEVWLPYCKTREGAEKAARYSKLQKSNTLDLFDCGLTAIPPELILQHKNKIQALYCQKNYLTSLPGKELSQCKNLICIVCFDNQLTELPFELGYCEVLDYIDCRHNKLENLPPQLGMLSKHTVISCVGNPLNDFEGPNKDHPFPFLKNLWGEPKTKSAHKC